MIADYVFAFVFVACGFAAGLMAGWKIRDLAAHRDNAEGKPHA